MANVLDLNAAELARFWSHVHPEPMSGCWLWDSTLYRNDYGQMTQKRLKRSHLAHRVMYQLEHGVRLDRSQVVRHRCDVRWCVNPDHLELGTQRDNILDAIRRGRFRTGSVNAAKTHCQHGHEFSEENTWRDKRGYRTCRTCHRDKMRERYRASKGEQ